MPNAAALHQALEAHLTGLGFSRNGSGYRAPEGLSKQKIRDLHAGQRREILQQHREFIDEEGPDLADHFADGKALDPAKIEPELIEVSAGSAEARLFRFAHSTSHCCSNSQISLSHAARVIRIFRN